MFLLIMIVVIAVVMVFLGHVFGIYRRSLRLLKNRWVITAVKIHICLYKEVIGKHSPAVSQQFLQEPARILSLEWRAR